MLKHEVQPNLLFIRLDEKDFIHQMVKDLAAQNIQSVIVEGGAQTLQLFINSNLWDEARVFTSTRKFEKGIAAPQLKGRLTDEVKIENDCLEIFFPLS